MKNAIFLGLAFIVLNLVSCKKEVDEEENCSATTSTVRFENLSNNPLRVDVSKENESNSDFTAALLTFELAAHAVVEKQVPVGVRFVRWTYCPPRLSCGKIYLTNETFEGCEEYSVYSGPR
jgi:hypothetical protein